MKQIINRLFYTSSFLVVTGSILQSASCNSSPMVRQDCIDTLQQAIASANSYFIKVHAGEALVANGYTDKVEDSFLKLREANPAQPTGATRVLARFYKERDFKKYQDCISRIVDQYLHADSTHPRLVGVESLGKLGYSDTLPEIIADARHGEGGFKAMARWVLSNNGAKETEDSLAALLASPEVVDYRGAAYALRFKKSVRESTYHSLEQCVARLNIADVNTVYVLSATFVHAPADKKEPAKKQLLQMVQGPTAAKYEVCEALSIGGDNNDLPLLETLFKDADHDVRVAASNAILKIQKRNAE